MNRLSAVRLAPFLLATLLVRVEPAHASAQVAPPPGGRADVPPPAGVAEIQRMFDSYALVQAQEQLKVADDKFPAFLSRFKALQDIRRASLIERTRVLMQLRRLINQGGDEAEIKSRLKALQDLDARAAIDMQKALDAVDQVLDVRQQAQFRLFEELMERKKIDLLMRARQANRLRNP